MGRALSRLLRVSGRPISKFSAIFKYPIDGVSYFPHTEALSGLAKVRPRTSRVRHSAPQAGGRAIPLALSLSSRRNPGLGAEGKIKSADAVEIHR